MIEEKKPDMACVPYRKKALYFTLTIPIMALVVLIFIYLWSFSFVLSIIFISFYILANIFQAYCCAYQECPYIGGFCPAIAGIMPANVIAKRFFLSRIEKSKAIFDLCATIASGSLLGSIVFPIFWIAKLSIVLAIAYPVLIVIYVIIFFLTICPVCAIRNTCPGGKLQNMMLRK